MYNGIKLSLFDKDTLTNGISICLSQKDPQCKSTNGFELGGSVMLNRMNGLSLGILYTDVDENLNGISFSGLLGDNWSANGLLLAGIAQLNDNFNGVSISGIIGLSDHANGFAITGVCQRVDSVFNGLSISGGWINAENFNGASIAPFNIIKKGHGLQAGVLNKANEFKGIQLGLLNINKGKKHFRVMPLINIDFRKKIAKQNIAPVNEQNRISFKKLVNETWLAINDPDSARIFTTDTLRFVNACCKMGDSLKNNPTLSFDKDNRYFFVFIKAHDHYIEHYFEIAGKWSLNEKVKTILLSFYEDEMSGSDNLNDWKKTDEISYSILRLTDNSLILVRSKK
ncbi:MAG TPA: hypothetical protein VE978_23120 [Chitinophagales bacterium]|nr:hypothetical protein [Chitinophagales bacterium]